VFNFVRLLGRPTIVKTQKVLCFCFLFNTETLMSNLLNGWAASRSDFVESE